jgi:hypothetical protein
MIAFSDWLKIRESSAATRLKRQAALGLAPPVADIFSRATPPPWQVDRLKSALKKSHSKKKKKKKKHMVAEASKPQPINKGMDSFIAAIERLAKDLWELRRLKKEKGAKESKQKSKELIKKVMKSQVKDVGKSKDSEDVKDKKKTDAKKEKSKVALKPSKATSKAVSKATPKSLKPNRKASNRKTVD